MLTSDQAAQIAMMYTESLDVDTVQHTMLAHVQYQSYLGAFGVLVLLVYCLVSLALSRPRRSL